jgi:hypothetical protein
VSNDSVDEGARVVRNSAIELVLSRLGRAGQQDAERIADSVVKHYRNILEAGAGVLFIGERPAADDLQAQMKNHGQTIVETALGALAAVLLQALDIGLKHGANR